MAVKSINKYGKNNVEKAIELASEYATLSVQSQGTQSSYPNISQLDFKFKDYVSNNFSFNSGDLNSVKINRLINIK